MTSNYIALIDMVKSLNYDEPGKLSNWIRDIIKSKEDFEKRYVSNQQQSLGRPQKFLVSDDARTLVDNLGILKPYMSFFEKSTDSDKAFAPYQSLKSGFSEMVLIRHSEKLQKRLERERLRSQTSIKALSSFIATLKNNPTIDITSVSLRHLMEASGENAELTDVSSAFQVAAWNDLIELKEELNTSEECTGLYRRIGEKMVELGDQSGALEALNEATKLDQADGIAWAIKAKIYLDKLRISKKEQVAALARTEFDGYIEHPLDAEEHSINERLDETASSTEKMHHLFVETSFLALENWPHWEHMRKNSDGNVRKNFMPNINITRECSSDISRDWLFFHLVIALRKTDLNDAERNRFISIFSAFQAYNSELNPIPHLSLGLFSFESDNSTVFDIKIINILSWLSESSVNLALQSMITRFRDWKHSASESIAILSRSSISTLIWDYLGKDEYHKLYLLCEDYEYQNNQKQRLEAVCGMQLTSILTVFGDVNDMIRRNEHPFLYSLGKDSKQKPSDEDILIALQSAITCSLEFTAGWHDILKEELWKKAPYDTDLPQKLLTLLFVAPLLEMMAGKSLSIGEEAILSFVDHKETMKTVVYALPFPLFLYIDRLVHTNRSMKLLHEVLNLVTKIHDEIESDSELY